MKRFLIIALCLAALAGMAAAQPNPWNPNYYDGTFHGHGDFVPKGNGVWDFGDPGNHWRKAYVDSIIGVSISGTISDADTARRADSLKWGSAYYFADFPVSLMAESLAQKLSLHGKADLAGYADSSHRADSLKYGAGYFAGTSFLRSDAPDTNNSKLYVRNFYFGNYAYGFPNYFDSLGNVYFNQQPGQTWVFDNSPGAGAGLDIRNYSLGGTGISIINKGIDNLADTVAAAIDIRCDSSGPAIRVQSLGKARELITLGGARADGSCLATYSSSAGNGIYLDNGGAGRGIYSENNFTSTGEAVFILNNNIGYGLRIHDISTGKPFYLTQEIGTTPAMKLGRGNDGTGLTDSTLFYYWGLRTDSIFAKSVLPRVANTGSLGSAANAWNAGYMDTVNALSNAKLWQSALDYLESKTISSVPTLYFSDSTAGQARDAGYIYYSKNGSNFKTSGPWTGSSGRTVMTWNTGILDTLTRGTIDTVKALKGFQSGGGTMILGIYTGNATGWTLENTVDTNVVTGATVASRSSVQMKAATATITAPLCCRTVVDTIFISCAAADTAAVRAGSVDYLIFK